MAAGDDETRIPGDRAGDQVGLGRVVQGRRSVGSPDPRDPGEPDDAGEVEEASEESFPASDPPTYAGDAATPTEPRDRARGAGEGSGNERR